MCWRICRPLCTHSIGWVNWTELFLFVCFRLTKSFQSHMCHLQCMHAKHKFFISFVHLRARVCVCAHSFVRFFEDFQCILSPLSPSYSHLTRPSPNSLLKYMKKNECHHNLCVSACLSVWTHMRNHIIPKETNKKPNHWKFSNLNVFSWNVCSIEKYIDIFSLFGTNLRERGKNGTQTHAAHHYYYVCALERFFPFSFVFFIFS